MYTLLSTFTTAKQLSRISGSTLLTVKYPRTAIEDPRFNLESKYIRESK